MDLLLDTHALIWFINGDNQLPDKSVNLIRNLENKCFVSIATVWEIAIKLSLGKLDLNGGFDEISKIMRLYDFELLPITFEHIQKLLTLDFHHRDPFDRIIISQGLVEKLTVITKDENFPKYNLEIVWKN
ncbi:MAG: type II toxin-antitoxin system VapC family toxin [Bacteroidota bacterium]|nr:type II toxin-antitoxin system VapC family toxin [Bacteroidota bacterium]